MAFLAACPADLTAYNWLENFGECDFTRKSVAQFGKVLGTRTDLRATRPSLASFGASALLLAALLGACGIAIAQTSAPLPKFEVASIPQVKPGTRGGNLRIPPGRFVATNITAKMLIRFAYAYRMGSFSLKNNQVLGGPGWINSDRFDIEAKVPDSLVDREEKKIPFDQWRDQIRLMIQSMLADRLSLKINQVTKQLPHLCARCSEERSETHGV
jgi:hypothetical protein